MSAFDNPGTRIASSIVIGAILLAVLLFFLPTYPMPSNLVDALEWVFDTLWGFDFMIPVITLMSAVGLILLVDVLFASWKLVLFLKKHLTKGT